ncbi:MAG TPA: DUF4293 domain-containing protein [Arachidicoccus sp.]
MIQRIQSLWLFIAAVLATLSFKFSFYIGTWLNGGVPHLQQPLNAYTPSVLVLVATVVTIVVSLIAIFMYKNRKQQLLLSVLDVLISIGLICLYIMEINKNFQPGSGAYTLTSIFVFLIPFVLILAIRGISRDIKLLKSADRLRN